MFIVKEVEIGELIGKRFHSEIRWTKLIIGEIIHHFENIVIVSKGVQAGFTSQEILEMVV